MNIVRVSDEADANSLRELISRHALWTNSARASEILGEWEMALRRFWKVVPHEAEQPAEPARIPGRKVRRLPVVEGVEGEVITNETDGPVKLVTKN